jgi:hypothetical protein
MLAMYPDYVNKHGFDPAYQFQLEATNKARAIIFADYFPSKDWPLLDKYKIITSIAQFYNTEDLNGYVKAVKKALHPDGVWIVQMQGLGETLKTNGIDNVCHEHTTYWDFKSFKNLLDRHGLYWRSVSTNNTNGGSIRYEICHLETAPNGFYDGITRQDFMNFARDVVTTKHNTMSLLRELAFQGKTVIGVAASTKFNTLAQFYGITPELMPAIAERSPEKIGRMTVGTHIPIISEEHLRDLKPDYLFACAGGVFDNFKDRYADIGAKWIKPLPTLEIIAEGVEGKQAVRVG